MSEDAKAITSRKTVDKRNGARERIDSNPIEPWDSSNETMSRVDSDLVNSIDLGLWQDTVGSQSGTTGVDYLGDTDGHISREGQNIVQSYRDSHQWSSSPGTETSAE